MMMTSRALMACSVRSWPEDVDQGLRLVQQNAPAITKIPPSVTQAAQV